MIIDGSGDKPVYIKASGYEELHILANEDKPSI